MAVTKKPQVAVIMGSKSDEETMKKAENILNDFGIVYDKKIMSAHRNPEKVAKYAKEAQKNGIKVIIAGAGLAAHLPGVIAAFTTVPVIGVPMAGGPLNGQDALYSIVQMPKGIPVASVGIGNATNAALLAAEIIGVADADMRRKLAAFRVKQSKAQ